MSTSTTTTATTRRAGVYESLGLTRIVNADARLTKLGGSLMPPEVVAAMLDAASGYVDMFAFQEAAGARLAELTRNEAAFVSAGAAAGLVVSTLACMVGTDLVALSRLMERGEAAKNEVIIHTAHRIPYDPAILAAGARPVAVGNALQTFDWELEAAITDRTAMILWVAGDHLRRGALPLEETVRIAHAHGVPVVVDAAAQLPPVDNFWRYTRDLGADLAVFSGGKDLRGPQASGLVVGSAALVAACRAHGSPNQRLARPMKAGKEEMAGLLAAVERYVGLDHAAILAESERVVAEWIAAFDGLPGISARRDFPNEAGQPTPRCLVVVDPAAAGVDAAGLRRRMFAGDPPVAAGEGSVPGSL
ncbi:MAG: aminotransferase class V-fold PLP-dependent enzyme, partial [Chloroflexota bacterium]